jgi:hypothetical protein
MRGETPIRTAPDLPGYGFDFDTWAELARNDPEAFEARRRACIEAFIADAPQEHRRRLRGVQFRIDMERRRARNPMAACLRLSSMMWDALLGPNGLRERLDELLDTFAGRPRAVTQGQAPPAEVLPFRVRGG